MTNNEPRMVEVFGTHPTAADIARRLPPAQRWFVENGFFRCQQGDWQCRNALRAKGLMEGYRLTRLGEAVKAELEKSQ